MRVIDKKYNFPTAHVFPSAMSRPPQKKGLKLPRQLQQELGLTLNSGTGFKRKSGCEGIGRRKERLKAEHPKRKAGSTSSAHHVKKPKGSIVVGYENPVKSDSGRGLRPIGRSTTSKEPRPFQPQTSKPPERKLRSILKQRQEPVHFLSSTDGSNHERSESPGLVLDRSSRSFRDRTAQDDADIALLEKKLGLRTKKLPKSFDKDGLGDLLDGIDSENETLKRKRDGQDWLEQKRRKLEAEDNSDYETEAVASEEDVESDLEADDLLEGGSEANESEEDGPPGFAVENTAVRERENPYVAPVSNTAKSATKYIPPSLRKQTGSDTESLQRLRRQVQGQLNKLSEANLLSILAETEKFYHTNARQYVASTLIDLILSLFCDPSVLQNTFVILHAAFVAALYKVIGTDFGAEFVSQLVHRFESFHKVHPMANGKQSVNLISLLAHLYTFHVIRSNLVFDHLRILLETLSETNAELLLRIVRDAGPQLRQDDPSSLKDTVLLMQKSAAKAQAEGAAISVRTKFMIETITDLKNNKLKSEIASSGVASEHITRMRKVVGTLNSRNIRASEPLRIGLSDVKNTEKRGKWWLIGASWREEEKMDRLSSTCSRPDIDDIGEIVDGEEADLLVLAREHRMNTAVRRAIFIAIMSATDYQDAHLRLLKLRLKRSQDQEIPRVLIHCAGAEEKYNPYYTLLAKTLCADKRLKMALQFSLWDFFKRLGKENDDPDGDDDYAVEELQLKEVVNTARMFGSLIADGTMSLVILKTLNLTLLNEQARMFVEVLLIVVITRSRDGASEAQHEESLARIFARCKDTPQMIGGLRNFLKKAVRHTDLVSSKSETELVKWGCGVAVDTLRVVSSGHHERV